MSTPPWAGLRDLVDNPVKEAARRVAGAAYRRVGALGTQVLGPLDGSSDDSPDGADGPDPSVPPWTPLPADDTAAARCPICRWHGDAFDGPTHVELSLCPGCGANGRDRFLHWCLRRRVELHPGLRVIECSPRLGAAYRAAMSTWFFYRTCDYDLRAHAGNLQLDLQNIDLPDACLDVLLCAHVLEHVPDTDEALAELRRVVAPGGHLLLQVPVLQGGTAPPATPEFHGDDTPVFWRFGFDLTARLRATGFHADLLCTEAFADAVRTGAGPWSEHAAEFDVPDMLAAAGADDLAVVADRTESSRLGIDPAYMYLTWDCTPA